MSIRTLVAMVLASGALVAAPTLPALAWGRDPVIIYDPATPRPTPPPVEPAYPFPPPPAPPPVYPGYPEGPRPVPPPVVPGYTPSLQIETYFNSAPYRVDAFPVWNGIALVGAGQPVNAIYRSGDCNPGGQPFAAVLSADPTRGGGSLWQEIDIRFAGGFPCQQLTSAGLVTGWAQQGLFQLQPTDRVYRLQVIDQH